RLAEEAGIPVIEQVLAREILYIADEVFFTGTAAEVTPVRSVDRIVVGKGQPGPVTKRLQERYLDIVEGRAEDEFGWLTYCQQPVATSN
ncbi:MAG TPA: branched chain amino acid aminotransferase, partial [Terriglobia bacterium]|nr:branched chain amino acid aminotransferase [Terriglobia bacterium]